jgi:hypothetical protein
MKVIPYKTSTGVQIGLRYNESPKPMPIEDQDMITIQGWFICKPEWHKARNLERLVYIWSAIFTLVILITVAVSK